MLKFSLKKKLLSLMTGLSLGGALLFPNLALSQVNVGPMLIFAETKQGKATGVISLSNEGSQEARMRLSARPFTYNENGFQFLQESHSYDLSPYLIFSPTEVILAPGQTRRVRLLANLLPSMKGGEYRSVILAEPLREKVTSGFSVSASIGVVVYVRHGETVEKLRVENSGYDPEKQQPYFMLKNEGNVTLRPEGNWQLTQNDRQIGSGDFKSTTVVAEGVRRIFLNLKNGDSALALPSGEYQVTGELKWGNDQDQKISFSVPLIIP